MTVPGNDGYSGEAAKKSKGIWLAILGFTCIAFYLCAASSLAFGWKCWRSLDGTDMATFWGLASFPGVLFALASPLPWSKALKGEPQPPAMRAMGFAVIQGWRPWILGAHLLLAAVLTLALRTPEVRGYAHRHSDRTYHLKDNGSESSIDEAVFIQAERHSQESMLKFASWMALANLAGSVLYLSRWNRCQRGPAPDEYVPRPDGVTRLLEQSIRERASGAVPFSRFFLAAMASFYGWLAVATTLGMSVLLASGLYHLNSNPDHLNNANSRVIQLVAITLGCSAVTWLIPYRIAKNAEYAAKYGALTTGLLVGSVVRDRTYLLKIRLWSPFEHEVEYRTITAWHTSLKFGSTLKVLASPEGTLLALLGVQPKEADQ